MSDEKQKKIIDEAVQKALAGDDGAINSIEDRIIRAKAKAALVKAKRSKPSSSDVSKNIISKNDPVAIAVDKALAGDHEAINNIEDKVIRAKAKAALVKAKRQNPKAIQDSSTNNDTEVNVEPTFNDIVRKKILEKFPDSLDHEQSDDWIQIKPENWLKIASWLHSDDELYFDSLQCNTGMDLGEGILESRYNLHSMKHLHKIEVRIKVTNDKPNIPSVEQVWRVADWFERETYDMYGINFVGHRDLRRILLPEDWEGWPLRKDYQEQETYHGIVVPKVKEGWE